MGYLIPDWPVPPWVRAAVTTRTGGVSAGPYAAFNLAGHVGDDPAAVAENRARLAADLGLAVEPRWLEQVHGTRVVRLDVPQGPSLAADAAWTERPGVALAVLVADCLPVFFADRAGRRVAVAHAGWRGLGGGVLRATVAALEVEPGALVAWLGPAIGPRRFEVGEEVRDHFLDHALGVEHRAAMAAAFARGARPGHYFADLFALARSELAALGVGAVGGGGLCTWEDGARFYSHRRDGVTGRMAAVIWLENPL